MSSSALTISGMTVIYITAAIANLLSHRSLLLPSRSMPILAVTLPDSEPRTYNDLITEEELSVNGPQCT